MKMIQVATTLNGDAVEFVCAPDEPLLDVLRNRLGLTGTKEGCGSGDCGACTITMDGRMVCACLVLAAEAEGAAITTIEGLSTGDKLHPLQQAFIDNAALQCGICTPGILIAAKTLASPAAKMAIATLAQGEHPMVMRELIALLRAHGDWSEKPFKISRRSAILGTCHAKPIPATSLANSLNVFDRYWKVRGRRLGRGRLTCMRSFVPSCICFGPAANGEHCRAISRNGNRYTPISRSGERWMKKEKACWSGL